MAAYRPDIPPAVAEAIRALPPEVKRGVKAAIRALATDPAIGGRLQGDLAGLMKYRVRRYRIVYEIVRPGRILRIVAVGHRRTVYDLLVPSR